MAKHGGTVQLLEKHLELTKNKAARYYANKMATHLKRRHSAKERKMLFDEPRPRLPKILRETFSYDREAPLRTRIKIGFAI